MTIASPGGAPESALASLRDRVAAEVRRVVVGQDDVVDLLLSAAVVGGHVLLEGMQEAQVSVDGVSHPLPRPFLVVATQNPIEYEGTYPLPEAQLDRFLLKVDVGYPTVADEEAILRLAHRGVAPATLEEVRVAAGPADIAAAQAEVDATAVADEVGAYVVAVVRRTRELPSVS